MPPCGTLSCLHVAPSPASTWHSLLPPRGTLSCLHTAPSRPLLAQVTKLVYLGKIYPGSNSHSSLGQKRTMSSGTAERVMVYRATPWPRIFITFNSLYWHEYRNTIPQLMLEVQMKNVVVFIGSISRRKSKIRWF